MLILFKNQRYNFCKELRFWLPDAIWDCWLRFYSVRSREAGLHDKMPWHGFKAQLKSVNIINHEVVALSSLFREFACFSHVMWSS